MEKLGRFAICSLLSATLLHTACASNEKANPAATQEAVVTGYFAVNDGHVVRYPDPLPNKIQYQVDWHDSGLSVPANKRYVGWDFNKDGRPDMLEVKNGDGSGQIYYFDFDNDGHVDVVREPAAPTPPR